MHLVVDAAVLHREQVVGNRRDDDRDIDEVGIERRLGIAPGIATRTGIGALHGFGGAGDEHQRTKDKSDSAHA